MEYLKDCFEIKTFKTIYNENKVLFKGRTSIDKTEIVIRLCKNLTINNKNLIIITQDKRKIDYFRKNYTKIVPKRDYDFILFSFGRVVTGVLEGMFKSIKDVEEILQINPILNKNHFGYSVSYITFDVHNYENTENTTFFRHIMHKNPLEVAISFIKKLVINT